MKDLWARTGDEPRACPCSFLLDPESVAAQSVGVLIGSSLWIAGKLIFRSVGNYVHLSFHPGAFPEAEIAASPQEFTAVATRVVELAAAGA